MKLILVRHGETEENKLKILQGHTHGVLSSNGIEQAKKLAQRLKNEKLDYIYSSDLNRTFDTAKEICKYHKIIKIQITKQLRESDFGDNTGKKESEIDFNNLPENWEDIADVQKRVVTFLYEIYSKHKNDTVLFATHFGCVVAILAHFLELDTNEILKLKQGNTAVNIIEINGDNKHILHLKNCTKHLD